MGYGKCEVLHFGGKDQCVQRLACGTISASAEFLVSISVLRDAAVADFCFTVTRWLRNCFKLKFHRTVFLVASSSDTPDVAGLQTDRDLLARTSRGCYEENSSRENPASSWSVRTTSNVAAHAASSANCRILHFQFQFEEKENVRLFCLQPNDAFLLLAASRVCTCRKRLLDTPRRSSSCCCRSFIFLKLFFLSVVIFVLLVWFVSGLWPFIAK